MVLHICNKISLILITYGGNLYKVLIIGGKFVDENITITNKFYPKLLLI